METEHPLMARLNAKMPQGFQALIEALRGGGQSYFKDGKQTAQYYGPASKQSPKGTQRMRTGMREYQLSNQERAQMGESPQTYQEWLKSSGS